MLDCKNWDEQNRIYREVKKENVIEKILEQKGKEKREGKNMKGRPRKTYIGEGKRKVRRRKGEYYRRKGGGSNG